MSIDDFLYEFEHFVESREFLSQEDGDPDDYRRGYRAGYWDALTYVKSWIEEEAEGDA
jgi:hypothetical protein